jgi:serine/threonine protein kinase/Flp pilus assembly protein TadD
MIKCPKCGHDSPETARSCVACAAPLFRRPTVAAAVLTPLPIPATSAPDAETIALPSSDPLSTGGTTGGLTPGQTFGNRYQIISLLGVGGMGAVYHVWDTELGLSLALKIIRPESDPLSAQELERRFKRELVLARQVTHRNVIRIHDLGEISGIKYITMPFVHGTDLARLLANDGKLPVERVIAFARQIVSGLRAAHEVGIVHRDLKPANILIEDDERAIITDFGIARSTDAGTFATAATAAGAIIGTIAYMAPEQASGRAVDQRADIYALGLILYEMLVGRRASSGGETALAMLIERSRQPPPGLRTIDQTIPEPIERLVTKCLEPDPNARYQTTADLEAAFDQLDASGHERFVPAVPAPRPRWLWPAAAVLVAIFIVLGGWMLPHAGSPSPPADVKPHEPISVLIADFENKAKEPVFQGSLEQALSIAIEGASFITSYSRSTAQAQLAQRKTGPVLDLANARLLAASEGINYILTGSIGARATGSGYTLVVNAVDPSNGTPLASASTDVDSKDNVLKGVQSVASTLREKLGDTTPESVRLAAAETVTTTSLEALKLYSQAQDLSVGGHEEESIKFYESAIRLDKDFARAYAGWGTALYNLGQRQQAEEKFKEALQRSDRMTERERYRTQGGYFTGPLASYQEGIEAFTALATKYPGDRAAHSNLGLAYFNMLDFPKAMAHTLTAVQLSPKSTRYRNNYALYAMYSSDFNKATEAASEVLKQNPLQVKAYVVMAAAALASSNRQGVRDAYAQMGKTTATGMSLANLGRADLALYEGKTQEAITTLKAGIEVDRTSKNSVAMAVKLVALAEAQLHERQTREAIDSAREAINLTNEDATLVPAALVLVRAGRSAEAQKIAASLAQQFQARSRAYAEMIHAEIFRTSGQLPASVDALGRARKLADLWLGRFLMGVTNVEGNRYQLAQNDLELCLKRKGEAMAIFLDDVPTFRYLTPVHYWLGRALEGQKRPGAADNYKAFLALRPEGSRDPLADDARKRLTQLK